VTQVNGLNPVVSLIICTRNRADSLRETLASIGRCDIPADLPTELLVVDNGSTDHTEQVVAEAALSNMRVRYLREPITGQAQTRNRALVEAKGDIFLCTDDDIRAFPNWVDAMCRPILEGRADATVGARVMPPHLCRAWMEPAHFECLACNEGRPERDLVGANMAFARYVLTRVPQFDTEIGLPVSAGGEDTLFSRQLCQAHFNILQIPQAVVAHHFHPDRLTRSKMRDAALKGAINDFYIEYHWMHQDIPLPWYQLTRRLLRLWYYRVKHCRQWWTHESMPAWEKGMIQDVRKTWLFIRERGKPRRYEQFGLKKLPCQADAPAGMSITHQRVGEAG
jgi:glycosyltransferase involved in cell wall biosynthesis